MPHGIFGQALDALVGRGDHRGRSASSSRGSILVATGAMLWFGCEGRQSRSVAEPTAVSTTQSSSAARLVTVDLRDPLLFRHNAQFFGGRTFRWLPPVPIFILTGDAFLDRQFDALVLGRWRDMTGVRSLFSRHPIVVQPPARGIYFSFADLPGGTVVSANPLSESMQSVDSTEQSARAIARRLAQSGVSSSSERRMELPEVLPTGEIVRCEIMLDPITTTHGPSAAYALFNGIGRCLGFVGPAPSGVMSAKCCSFSFTSDVRRVMRKLYSLPPGTPVSR